MPTWLLLSLALLAAWTLTGLLRRYALHRQLLDIPNARSSHSLPTPRGGGVAIVLCFLVPLAGLSVTGHVSTPLALALLGAGSGVALLGFLDDHGHIAARWRLLGHFGGGAWVLAWLGGLPPLVVFGHPLELGLAGHALALLYLVWLLNLYNFMDGIDGIASVEAMTTCLGGALMLTVSGATGGESLLLPLGLLAAATAGFLCWNLPPARIFMGDAGSGFLGLALGALSIASAWASPALFWGWLILLGTFIVDATCTLMRRWWRGERVYEAHRSHAYQHASRRFGGHGRVTLTVAAINLAWLLPLALLVASGRLDGALGTLIAWLPLAGLALALRAGQPG